MITIFHGDDIKSSRSAFLSHIKEISASETLTVDGKNINLNEINSFLNSGSLFPGTKLLAISNFFSASKPIQTKIVPMFSNATIDIIIWQDKTLTAVQLNTLSDKKVFVFKANNDLYTCLNALKPKNLPRFLPLLDKVIAQDLFDLFYYLLKGSIRKQLQSRSAFNQKILLKTYLQLAELEFQFKTGLLSLPRETALKRVLIPLLR